MSNPDITQLIHDIRNDLTSPSIPSSWENHGIEPAYTNTGRLSVKTLRQCDDVMKQYVKDHEDKNISNMESLKLLYHDYYCQARVLGAGWLQVEEQLSRCRLFKSEEFDPIVSMIDEVIQKQISKTIKEYDSVGVKDSVEIIIKDRQLFVTITMNDINLIVKKDCRSLDLFTVHYDNIDVSLIINIATMMDRLVNMSCMAEVSDSDVADIFSKSIYLSGSHESSWPSHFYEGTYIHHPYLAPGADICTGSHDGMIRDCKDNLEWCDIRIPLRQLMSSFYIDETAPLVSPSQWVYGAPKQYGELGLYLADTLEYPNACYNGEGLPVDICKNIQCQLFDDCEI